MFDEWLRQLSAARKGPVTLHATRGRAYVGTITLNVDFTGSTLRGQVRLYPDAPGSALASFTVVGPTVIGSTTSFELQLTAATVNGLPADTSGDGYIDLAYDILITPSGGTEELLMGGIFTVVGRVTV